MTGKTERQPFLYVAVRPFLEKTLTTEQSEKIAARKDSELELVLQERTYELTESAVKDPQKWQDRLKKGWHYEPRGVYRVELIGVEKLPIVEPTTTIMGVELPYADSPFESYSRFVLQTEDDALLETLAKCKDAYIPCEKAFERRMTHWGTERWSGLQLTLRDGREKYLESAIDVFAPSQKGRLGKQFVMAAYSEKLR